jgi:hypothetical protein
MLSPLTYCAWWASVWSGVFFSFLSPILGVLVGGAVGGFILGICEAIYRREATTRNLVYAVMASCGGAIPLCVWNANHEMNLADKASDQRLQMIGFARRWCVMGSYLYLLKLPGITTNPTS